MALFCRYKVQVFEFLIKTNLGPMVIYLGFWSLFIQMLFSSIRFLFPQISIVHRLSPPPRYCTSNPQPASQQFEEAKWELRALPKQT